MVRRSSLIDDRTGTKKPFITLAGGWSENRHLNNKLMDLDIYGFRVELGLTQEKAGKLFNVSRHTIMAWESRGIPELKRRFVGDVMEAERKNKRRKK